MNNKLTTEQTVAEQEIKQFQRSVKELSKVFDLLELVSLFTRDCVYLCLDSSFGFENPAYTGMLSGSLWGLKGVLETKVRELFQFNFYPEIRLNPSFDIIKPVEIEVESIFKFRLGNIIITGLKLLALGLKRRFRDG